ncbi:preprotein translocase subunit SecE [Ornithobacterium rhinotracheale]|uniref:Protein translocase subunit SecE n=1 Tax=Ornithobacterium rhinotracheale TaxID=28251 RepID=A0A410JTB9_ORNRH|nr:preprotein translocase subunit SecE [Ornithobacterium rhinotracheale]QAR31436.1 preprotein translocase subunit SecE [Ornithobacterium rhinotracheale]
MKGIVDFLKGSYSEFAHHVSWPKWNELQSSTIVIAVCTLILAILLFGVDALFSEAINGFYDFMKR